MAISKHHNAPSHGLGDAVRGHHIKNIAQDGAPKRTATIVPAHGMHAKINGQHFANVGGDLKSAVESGSVGPGIGDMLATLPKARGVHVDTVLGHRSRNGEVGPGMVAGGVSSNHVNAKDHDKTIGARILAGALYSGSTRLPGE